MKKFFPSADQYIRLDDLAYQGFLVRNRGLGSDISRYNILATEREGASAFSLKPAATAEYFFAMSQPQAPEKPVTPLSMGTPVVIASQDFNALADGGSTTTDGLTDGSPLTNAGSFNSGGGGLDFASYFFNTRGTTGPVTPSSDTSDFIGVNSFAGSGAPDVAADGTAVASGSEHNYQFNDTDGRIDLVFAPVDLSGHESRTLSLNYWVAPTGFEADDSFSVTISDGTTTVTLLSLGETGLEAVGLADAGNASEWTNLSVDLDNVIAANSLGDTLTLTISADTNSGSENIFVDDIVFEGVELGPLAFALVNSADSNLTSFVANPDNSATNGAFPTSAFDVFGITDRTVNSDFADDSLSGADSLGILGATDTDLFFGAEDVDNSDNPGGTGTATWTFDVSAGTIGDISIDFAAMGDFEEGDNTYTVTASLDGGASVTLFQIDTDNDGVLAYTMEDGSTVTYNDPMLVDIDGDAATIGDYDGTLTNDFVSYVSSALSGQTGSSLVITLTAGVNNGGGELFAMRDIVIDRFEAPAGTTLAIAATDAVKAEGDAGTTSFTFTVTRSGDTSGATDVDWAVTSSDADAADFGGALPSGTVNFLAGETTQVITVNVSGDTDAELDEDFTVKLSNATGGAGITTATADGTIQNDDGIAYNMIHDIQGTADTAALNGQTVTIQAIVTGDFQNGDGDTSRDLGGFYVQEEDSDWDMDLLTSEGIFIYEGSGNTALDVNVGDLVTITGVVGEFSGQTQIASLTSVSIVSSGNALPSVTTISPSTQNLDELEAYESMLISINEELTVTEMFNYDRFGEIRLNADGRVSQYTQDNAPSVAGYTAWLEELADSTITYEDGVSGSNNPASVLDGVTNTTADIIQMGDTITDLSGVMTYGFSAWRIRSTEDGENTFTDTNVRLEVPESPGGDIQVASLNVLNFFNTLDNGSNTTANGSDPRGAEDATEYSRQLEKLVTAILDINASVLGLVEIENDFLAGSSGNAVESLVAALNAVAGAGTYAWVDPGTQFVGDDAIANALIYQTAAVSLTAGTTVEILDDSDLAGLGIMDTGIFNGNGSNRAILAATFTDAVSGETFTTFVNHLKSKGSLTPGGDPGNVDAGDGQGNNNAQRLAALEALQAWIATDPTGAGSNNNLLLGDLNAYASEDPLTYLESEGYINLETRFLDPGYYSYVFDGQVGTLDYILANGGINPFVTGAFVWNVNSDEADLIDYNLNVDFDPAYDRDPSIFDGSTPYRYSDHDPVVIGLNFDPNVYLYSDNSLVTLLDTDDFLNPILASAADGQYIDIFRETAVGVISGFTDVTVDNLTINGDLNFGASFELDAAVFNITLTGTQISNVLGNDSANTITTGDGHNLISGQGGADIISSGAGNDRIEGGAGDDIIDGGADRDIIQYIRTNGAVTVDLSAETATSVDGTDTLLNFESVFGSRFGDVITGNDDNNVIRGLGGADTINGGLGNDILEGGLGDDNINGGDGQDIVLYVRAGSAVTVDLEAGTVTGGDGTDTLTSIERATGSDFDDTFISNGENNLFRGGSGADDYVFGASHGRDRIADFEQGQDTIVYSLTSGVSDFSDLTITQVGNTVKIESSAGIVFAHNSLSTDFDASDFQFIATPPPATMPVAEADEKPLVFTPSESDATYELTSSVEAGAKSAVMEEWSGRIDLAQLSQGRRSVLANRETGWDREAMHPGLLAI